MDGIRILIAENSEEYRRFLVSLLGSDYIVETCSDRNRLIDRYLSFSPQIVLMDVSRDAAESLGAIRYIRSQANDNDVFILVLSGQASNELMIRALNCGANDYILKTLVREELLARLEVARRQISLVHQLHLAYRRISSEMDTVADLQNRLLPREHPVIPGINLDWLYHPSGRASGDYFDYFAVNDHVLRFVVADVSGHGARAAFIMNTVRTIFQVSRRHHLSLDQVITFINEDLCGSVGDEMDFVTLAACDLNLQEKSVLFINAGHCPGLFCIDHQVFFASPPTARPLGFFKLDLQPVKIAYSDWIKIMLFTDGFYEWEVEPNEFLGLPRFLDLAGNMMAEDDFCLQRLKTHLESIPEMPPAFRDDLTALVVQTSAL
ncbi:PP2C family protein-serine/threonine phosphatase [Desulfonatronovibrio hydrogenovorans]|uniref:PP2C family protein-serine/threonine phosphatase n=1 Tax=Desulfonatronovibrio hydrogenovorans TaxID=53245 RepID=UPI00048D5C63|nr:SpoIIE family protein phosphatase [Desulfonatronovibrio hydrogenovorans]